MVSVSQLSEWIKCRYRWHLKYERNIVPRIDAISLQLGKVVHIGLSAALLGKDPLQAIDEYWSQNVVNMPIDPDGDIAQSLEQLLLDAKKITIRALDYLKPEEWEPLELDGAPLVERRLIVPIPGSKVSFQGYVDAVLLHKPKNQIWLFDHKVRKAFQDNTEEVDLQRPVYQYQLFRHGITANGSITFQIRSQVPSAPKLNRDGTMSRQKIATDWETYKAALLENHLDPNDYLEMADKLSEIEWFKLTKSHRSIAEVKTIWSTVALPASWDILRMKKRIYRSLGTISCRACWARDFCLAELRGDDIDYLLNTSYIKKMEEEEESDAV